MDDDCAAAIDSSGTFLRMPAMPKTASSRREAILLALCLALAAVLHLGMLNHHSLRNNELITLESIQQSVPDLIRERLRMNHMPGYFLTVKAWTSLLGTRQIPFRLPSALCGFAGLLMLWRLGRRLYGPDLGLFVLLAATLNEALVFVSMDARMYSWLFCATAWAIWMSIRYLEDGRASDGWGVAAAGLFGLLGHNLYLIVPLCLSIYLLIAHRRLPVRWKKLALFAWLPALALIPLIVYYLSVQTRVGGAQAWGEFQSTNALRQVVTVSFGEYGFIDGKKWRDFESYAMAIAFLLAAAGAAFGTNEKKDGDSRASRDYTLLFFLLAFVPGLLIAIAQMHSRTSMVGAWRYYIASAAAAPLLFARALAALRGWLGRWPAAALGAPIVAILTANTFAFLNTAGSGFRESSAYMKAHWQPGDQLIASRVKHGTYAFVYYGLLAEKPAMLADGVEEDASGAAAVERLIETRTRFWAVFLDELKSDPMAGILKKFPDRFRPLGEMQIFGDTAIRLYAAPSRPAGASAADASTTSTSKTAAPLVYHDDDNR